MAAAEAPRPEVGTAQTGGAARPEGDLPKAVDLGDGTMLVHGRRGEVRLSRDRSRWWNGRAWQPVAASTPWNAHFDADGKRWWDGVEWRQREATAPIWMRRPALMVAGGNWLVWVVLLAAGVVPIVCVALLVVVGIPGIVLTLTSKVLRGGEKGLFLLSVVGLAILWVRGVMARRGGRGAGDGSAHLVL